jgi:hypothetical protein
MEIEMQNRPFGAAFSSRNCGREKPASGKRKGGDRVMDARNVSFVTGDERRLNVQM